MDVGLLASSLASVPIEDVGIKTQNKGQKTQFENLYRTERESFQKSSKDEKNKNNMGIYVHKKKDAFTENKNNKNIKEDAEKYHDDKIIEKDDTKNVKDSNIKNNKTEKCLKENKEVSRQTDDRQQYEEFEKELREIFEKLGITTEDMNYILKLHRVSSVEMTDTEMNSFIEKLSGLVGKDVECKEQLLGQIKSILQQLGAKATIKVGHIRKIENQENSKTQKREGQLNYGVNNDKTVENTPKEQKNIETVNNKQVNNKQSEDIKNNEKIISDAEQNDNKSGSKVSTENTKKIHSDAMSKTSGNENEVKQAIKEGKQEQKDVEAKTEGTIEKKWTDKVKIINDNKGNADINIRASQENVPQAVNSTYEVKDVKMDTKVNNFVQTSKEEVLKQVVDKAVAMISKDKAEMVVELKPDNLGKLSMKVVTERGMMTAQIIAENQQVKQIIESNFNVLRDALEKQGITVQQLNVSVGQDSWKNNFSQNAQRNYIKSNNKNQNINGISVSGFGYQGGEQIRQAYMWPESTINFTA